MPNKSRWALPEVPEPEGTRCFQITIPDDLGYIAALKGAIYNLTLWQNWDRDEDHNGTIVAHKMMDAYLSITECEAPTSIQLRTCPTDCGIEYSTDGGDTWTCIDLGPCIENIWDEKLAGAFDDGVLGRGVGQQGPQGAPDEHACYTYHVKLNAKDQWHCPSPVSAGDSIEITNASGGWSDGTVKWYCPNGDRYLLGSCHADNYDVEETDPLTPDTHHMSLVGVFGETFFDPLASVYTVPNGTETTDFLIQANDASLSDNVGEVEFDVTVCTGGAAWCVHLDFRVTNGGFLPWGGIWGEWVSGTGWVSSKNNYTEQIYIYQNFDPNITTTHVRMVGYMDGGTLGDLTAWYNNGMYIQVNPVGSDTTFDETSGVEDKSVSQIGFGFVASTGEPDRKSTLTDAWIWGHGPNPWGGSNC